MLECVYSRPSSCDVAAFYAHIVASSHEVAVRVEDTYIVR